MKYTIVVNLKKLNKIWNKLYIDYKITIQYIMSSWNPYTFSFTGSSSSNLFGSSSTSSNNFGSSSSYVSTQHNFISTPSSNFSFNSNGFDYEKSRRESEARDLANKRAEQARQADLEAYRLKCRIQAEQIQIQTQQTITRIAFAQEEADHKARMKKAADIENQVKAIEELKIKSENELGKLEKETEALEKQIADDLAFQSQKLSDLYNVHQEVINVQNQQLEELKKKTQQQKQVVERSKEGLNKVVGYAESFSQRLSSINSLALK